MTIEQNCKKVKPQQISPKVITLLWEIIIGLLITIFIAGIVLQYGYPEYTHPHFAVEQIPGFYSIFGFISCIAIIYISKLLGFILKRDEDFYEKNE